MLPKPERASRVVNNPKPFVGFSETGSVIRSEVEIANAITRFVAESKKHIREKFLSPESFEMMLRTQPTFVRSAFPNAYLWSLLHRPWDWFAATTSTSAEESLKRSVPDHTSDPNAYQHWVEAAERFHGYPCRFSGVPEVLNIAGTEVCTPTLNCRVHPA